MSAFAGGLKALFGKLNPARLLRAAAKKILVKAVQVEGDRMQKKLKDELDRKGPAAVDSLFDGWQARLITAVNSAKFVPPGLRDAAVAIIQREGDRLQERISQLLRDRGGEGIDLAFDTAQQAIIERIEAL